MTHPSTERALDEIDAAVFSGDCFHSKAAVERLRFFLGRWDRAATAIEEDLKPLSLEDMLE